MELVGSETPEAKNFPNANAERQWRYAKRQQDRGRRPRRIWLTDGEYAVFKRRLGKEDPSPEGLSPGTSLFAALNGERIRTGEAHGLIDLLCAFNEPPEAIDYVLPNMVAGSVGALVSPGGTGKSMFALQLAAQIAGGLDLLGLGSFAVGPVVYLPAEDPPIALRHRLYALGQQISPQLKIAVAENLLIQPLIGTRPDLLDPKWCDNLLRIGSGKRLIILDTLRRFHGEEENASGPMSQVIGRMEEIASETGCSILFVHHTGKVNPLTGMGEQSQTSRGSSVLVDNVRWQGHLSGMTKREAEEWGVQLGQRGNFVRFSLSKVNYGGALQDRWYKRAQGGILTPVVLEEPTAPYGASRAQD